MGEPRGRSRPPFVTALLVGGANSGGWKLINNLGLF